MLFDNSKHLCRSCGQECEEDSVYCKRCKPKKVIVSFLALLITFAFALAGNIFLPLLLIPDIYYRIYPVTVAIVDNVLLVLCFLPFIITIIKVRSAFKP